MKNQWYYRGSLKSCNYTCSYCPFSKKKEGIRKLQKDKEDFFRFVEGVNGSRKVQGAVQVVPYGEALIHPYYWEGLAALSQNPRLDAVGAQSNFSFSIEDMLEVYCTHGGNLEKLRLWGTFHPEMTSVDRFLNQCYILSKKNVLYCVGAVGVPENLEAIRCLRESLPTSVYLWINRMDGMGRPYTEAEVADFLNIDEYFKLQLAYPKADSADCVETCFVEADGTMRRCNLCRHSDGNFYKKLKEELSREKLLKEELLKEELSEKILLKEDLLNDDLLKKDLQKQETGQFCGRKTCSCYLAYCSRNLEKLLFFKPYPAFRIPVYPEAVFMDLDGTLIPDGESRIPEKYVRWLGQLSRHSRLYLATSLPYEAAVARARQVWPLLSGGVFANGARCTVRGEGGMDEVCSMDVHWIAKAKEEVQRVGGRMYVYKKDSSVYKVTIVYRKGSCRRRWEQNQNKDLIRLTLALGIPPSCQVIQENGCIQVTRQGTGKLQGILRICREMGYARQSTAVFGDSVNDIPMLEYFPFSVAAKGSSEQVKKSAVYAF